MCVCVCVVGSLPHYDLLPHLAPQLLLLQATASALGGGPDPAMFSYSEVESLLEKALEAKERVLSWLPE